MSDICVCGHVKVHHGKQELAMLPYYPDCQWRGCGCPKFVAGSIESLRIADWWQTVFATRFMSNNLPQPGDALYGQRFVLYEETPDGLKEWRRGE